MKSIRNGYGLQGVFSDDVFTIYGLFTQEGHILVGQIGYRYWLCRKYLKGTEKMKPLYILAAALTALPVLATAEVRLYGEIKSGVEASRIKSGGSSVSHSGVYDSGSYIGLRGSLPIGSGNNVLFQAEQDTPVGSRRMSRTVWHSPSPHAGNMGDDAAGQFGKY